jgi:hypothetical protein
MIYNSLSTYDLKKKYSNIMHKIKNFLRVSIFVIFISAFLAINSTASTVLGESIFPAEEGDEFIWETVNATESWYIEVEYVKFEVESIFNQTYLGSNYLFMNYSLNYYRRFGWIPHYENSFYMAYNKTLNFLNWSSEAYMNGIAFLYPTPLNFSLIQNTIEASGPFNTSLDGDKLILDYGNTTTIEHTIDDSGISTTIEKITNNTTIFKWELNTDEVIVRIPLGNEFLVFTFIGVVSIVYFSLKKIKIKDF